MTKVKCVTHGITANYRSDDGETALCFRCFMDTTMPESLPKDERPPTRIGVLWMWVSAGIAPGKADHDEHHEEWFHPNCYYCRAEHPDLADEDHD